MNGLVGIAIVNYRTAEDTDGLVRSIVARNTGTATPVAIALVDNSAQQAQLAATVELATRNDIRCRLIAGHGNVGYAAGNNLAGRWLLDIGADVIWVLNPDTRLERGTPGQALDLLRFADRAVAATAAQPVAVDLWTGRSGPGLASARRLPYVAGHSLLATRKAWEDLDGFSEDFFLFYEEADLAVRCAGLGIPTTTVPELVVSHAGGRATGARTDLRRKSRTAYFHASRSCMVFFRKHYPARLPMALAARLLYAGKVLLVAGPAAATAIVRGAIAGLRP